MTRPLCRARRSRSPSFPFDSRRHETRPLVLTHSRGRARFAIARFDAARLAEAAKRIAARAAREAEEHGHGPSTPLAGEGHAQSSWSGDTTPRSPGTPKGGWSSSPGSPLSRRSSRLDVPRAAANEVVEQRPLPIGVLSWRHELMHSHAESAAHDSVFHESDDESDDDDGYHTRLHPRSSARDGY